MARSARRSETRLSAPWFSFKLAQRVAGSATTGRLITTYLSYLHHSQREDGLFHNFMDYREMPLR